jgi:hypothetical protein
MTERIEITKEARYEHELAVHASRHEGGVRAVHAWLCGRRDEINVRWTGIEGDDLVKLQGEAACVVRLIRLIELGPTIKYVAKPVGGV